MPPASASHPASPAAAATPLLDVLIVASTAAELNQLAPTGRPSRSDRFGHPFQEFACAGLRVGTLVTGVGKVNAALTVSAFLQCRTAELLLCVGVGGAYPGSGLAVGDLAVATEEHYADEGTELETGFADMAQIGLPLWDAPRCYNCFPVDGAVAARLHVAARGDGNVQAGPFATVSTVTGSAATARARAGRLGAVCESMEGAALAHAALAHGIRFGELRGISNPVGPRDRAAWRLTEAAAAAQAAVLAFLEGGGAVSSAARPAGETP